MVLFINHFLHGMVGFILSCSFFKNLLETSIVIRPFNVILYLFYPIPSGLVKISVLMSESLLET